MIIPRNHNKFRKYFGISVLLLHSKDSHILIFYGKFLFRTNLKSNLVKTWGKNTKLTWVQEITQI